MQRRGVIASKRRLNQLFCGCLLFVIMFLYVTTSPSEGIQFRRRKKKESFSHSDHRDDVELHGDSDTQQGVLPLRKSVWRRCGALQYLNNTVLLTGSADADKASINALEESVVLVVNVASHCGFTEMNYRELTRMHDEFHGRRHLPLRILAFPCNQFGAQEADPPQAILNFARNQYHAKFDMMEKVDVNGDGTHRLYRKLKKIMHVDSIAWNFGKFLVDRHGKVVSYYDTRFPFEKIRGEVEALLLTPPTPTEKVLTPQHLR